MPGNLLRTHFLLRRFRNLPPSTLTPFASPQSATRSGCLVVVFNLLRQQPASRLEKLLMGARESLGGFGRKCPEGGLGFLEVALVLKNLHPESFFCNKLLRSLSRGTPQTSKKSLQKRFHAEACTSIALFAAKNGPKVPRK